jgi:transposase-like protein
VEGLVQTLGIERLSKSRVSEMAKSLDEHVEDFRHRPLAGAYPFLWLDALLVKSREGGRIVNVAVVVAVGVNDDGRREILGLDVVTTEDGAGWLAFLRSLVSRGLTGVVSVTSDAHSGLQDAIAATLPGASWQRCRTHFMTNLLTRIPKAAQSAVATLVRSIFLQPDAEAVWTQHRQVTEQLENRFPQAAELLAEAAEEVLDWTLGNTRPPIQVLGSIAPVCSWVRWRALAMSRPGSLLFCRSGVRVPDGPPVCAVRREQGLDAAGPTG